MTEKEIQVVLKKAGDDLVITLPGDFCQGTTLREGAELKVLFNERGNLELGVNRVAAEPVGCQICDKGSARYQCSNCGTKACSSCFWEWGGLCHRCAKT